MRYCVAALANPCLGGALPNGDWKSHEIPSLERAGSGTVRCATRAGRLGLGLHPWIVESEAPVYIIRVEYLERAGPTRAEVADYVAAVRAFWIAVDRPIGIVTDLTLVGQGPAWARKMLAECDAELRPIHQRYLRAWAVVIGSSVQKLLFTGYLWLTPAVVQPRIVKSVGEGVAWARQQLGLGVSFADVYRTAERLQKRR